MRVRVPRERLDSAARQASLSFWPLATAFRYRFRSRSEEGATSASTSGRVDTGEVWVEMERRGDLVAARFSLDQVEWSETFTAEFPGLADQVLVGVESSCAGTEPSCLARVCDLRFTPAGARFLRGDCNGDLALDIADPVLTLESLFLGEGRRTCEDACDANDDGEVNVADAIMALSSLFLEDTPLPAPGPDDCGVDPTEDELECESYSDCD